MIRSGWDLAAFDLPPVAAATGPFPDRSFLETWWTMQDSPPEQLLLAADENGLIPAALTAGTVEFVAHEDVTDYHSPRGTVSADLVGSLAASVPHGTPFRFDSLPLEAADAMTQALLAHTRHIARTEHVVAAVLGLPATFDDYLMAIGKKERHETRRKRRRFTAEIGEPHLVRAAGAEHVRLFANMHRLSSGDKGDFMSEAMEAFFVALHERCGAVIDLLAGDDGVPVAAAFGFEDASGYYLYNSAYDPEAGHASPGVVLVSRLIENVIESGRTTFDFLKGDETYKFRLGASPRPLYVLEGQFGNGA